MLKVKDIPYQRYTIEQAKAAYDKFESAVKAARSAAEVIAAREGFVSAMVDFATEYSLANMRYTLNTRDEFYKAEKEYYDNIVPLISELNVQYGDKLLSSPYRDELEKQINPILFKRFEIAKKAHSPENIEDEQLENSIVTEYSQLMSQMLFDYEGKKVPLTLVRGDLNAADRAKRKAAADAIGRGLQENAQQLDEIFDRLVKVRDRQAKRLGLDNFIQLGYYRMDRLDYDREMVEKFRKNVRESIVPAVAEMKKSVAKRLGISQMKFYDDSTYFLNEGVAPKVQGDEILSTAQHMYNEMNGEIGKFMKYMLDADAFDVQSREGKWGGGYCTEFQRYNQPFILANFNGSADDIDVVTHEFGHAYASYCAGLQKNYELNVGSMETAECHSMSMEFLSWKYMDKFFNQPEKYKYKHVCDSFSFIPYGCMVDEFQHIVYENPALTPAERKSAWKKLENTYRPYLSMDGIPYLENGTRWQYQMHIYESPFYYIDYCLAQTVALGFLMLSRKDYELALKRYIGFVKSGGTKLFSALVKDAGIANPFGDGTLDELSRGFKDILAELKI